MLQAVATLEGNKKLIILGLSHANVIQLLKGRPIKIDSTPMGFECFISIFVGKDESSMREDLADLIGPDTIVHDDADLTVKKPEGGNEQG